MSCSNPNVINATAFVPERDIKYTKPKINKSGGKGISILNAHLSKGLMLSTPLMLTWGLGEFIDEKTGKRSYDLALQFPRDEFRKEDTDKFLKGMQDFQEKIKADAIINSKEWMNNPKLTPEVVDALFHPMLKYSKDPATGEADMTKSPTMKIKVDYWDNNFTCEIYGTDGRIQFPVEGSMATPMDLVPKASEVALVIQCGGLWFANGKFGVTWKLVQAVVKPKPSMKGKCLISFPQEQQEQSQQQQQQLEVSSKPQQVSRDRPMEIVDESEDDGEEEADNTIKANGVDEEEYTQDVHSERGGPSPTPAPTPAQEEPPAKVVKKIVRKVPAKA